MWSRRRLIRSTVVLLATFGPATLILMPARVLQELPRSDAPSVTRFTDYFVQPMTRSAADLVTGSQLWGGSPGDGSPFFASMEYIDGSVVLLSDRRFVAVDANTGAPVLDITLGDGGPLDPRPTSLLRADEPKHVWVYYWSSGKLSLHRLESGLPVLRTLALQRSLRSLQWHKNTVVASGLFASEIIRLYDLEEHGKMLEETPSAVLGAPLFPRLIDDFGEQLNVAVVALRPSRSTLAVAFKWSDKIDIYDLEARRLERSIAGPRQSRLSFGVADRGGKPAFTLGEDTIYSHSCPR